ncbi:MAG TPA: gliding motility-associated C-terminal domain-containing protein [Chitinophagaceae bacterium]|nr:gliding motility-associated C-terminal domain-containing protein [Chitinophagaceae bacterium]
MSLSNADATERNPSDAPKSNPKINLPVNLHANYPVIDTAPPLAVCDTSAFRITFGGKGNFQLLDVKSLSRDEAISSGQTNTSGNEDGWLLKTGKYGNILWTRTYGGGQADYFTRVLPSSDGGFLATGSSDNSGSGMTDGTGWAVKTDATGKFLWSYVLDIAPSVIQQACQTRDGGFAMVASVNVSGSEAKIIVIKVNAEGSPEWMKSYSNGPSDYGYFIKQTLDGDILIAGFVYALGAGMHDGFLMKVSAKDGTPLWMKTYGSPGDDVIDCLDEDAKGALYLSLNWSGNGSNLASIVKTSPDGKVIWAKLYKLPFPSTRGYSLKLTPDGGVALSISDATTRLGGAVMKTDKNGAVQWAYDYHPSGDDSYAQCAADELSSHRGFYVTGYAGTVGYLAKTDKTGKAGTCPIRSIKVSTVNINPVVQFHQWDIIEPITGWHTKEEIKVATPAVTRKLICPECCVSSNTTIDTSICQGIPYTLPDGSQVTKAGTYPVKFTSYSGCDSIITTRLTVNPVYHQTVKDSICPHQHYRLPDGSVVDTAGTYVSALRTKKGCDSIITTKLTFRSRLYIQYLDSICEGTSFRLPNGRTIHQAGTFRMLLPSATSCDTLATYQVSIKKPPDIALGKDTCLVAGQSVLLNPGRGYPHYRWQNGATDSTQEVSLPGTYWVRASNKCGTTADSIRVSTGCAPVIFIPNAFTPNGDGVNDVFRILNTHGQQLITFNVYDRSGLEMFHTTRITGGWDGTFKGQSQQMGAYIYLIKLINLAGARKIYKGTVLLIR